MDGSAYACRLRPINALIDTDDLIDAHGVADLLGLTHRNTVSQYLERYSDMPRPVVDLGRGRPRLWLRSEIGRWAVERKTRRRKS